MPVMPLSPLPRLLLWLWEVRPVTVRFVQRAVEAGARVDRVGYDGGQRDTQLVGATERLAEQRPILDVPDDMLL